MTNNDRHVGIDVGERKLFAVCVEPGKGIELCGSRNIVAVTAWAIAQDPESVAIDSPPRHSLGTNTRRACEAQLNIGGCYATPPAGVVPPGWMATGMQVHHDVAAGLHAPLGLTGMDRVFEVHPTYGFKSAIDVLHRQNPTRVTCDPQRRLRPKSPPGSVGHLQRIELLREIVTSLSVSVDQATWSRLRASLDLTDAAMAACIGALRRRGETILVGDPAEGVIVIVKPRALAAQALASAGASPPPSASPPPAPSAPPPMTARAPRATGALPKGADAALLRLGKRGLKVLSQEQTLHALSGQAPQDDILLPLGIGTVGRGWIEAAQSGGFWLLVAWGEIRLALHVVAIVGNGRRKPTPREDIAACSHDAWPMIAASEYWLVSDELLIFDHPYPFSAIQTLQAGAWTAGVPASQAAWLHVRVTDQQLRQALGLPPSVDA
jgi:hypothetical protein